MTRLAETFARTRAEGRAALIAFVTGGDPTPAGSAAILDALVEGGADIIELGMPFTDPMADGPAIQRANLRALAAGTTTADLLAIATAWAMPIRWFAAGPNGSQPKPGRPGSTG